MGRTLEGMDARRALVAGMLILAAGAAAILLAHANPRAQILGGILLDVGSAAMLLGALLWRWQRQLDRVDVAITRAALPEPAAAPVSSAAPARTSRTRARAAG